MPQRSQLNTARPSRTFSVGLTNELTGYISQKLIKRIGVKSEHKDGTIRVYDKGAFLGNSNDIAVRAPGARYPQIDYKMGTDVSYVCEEAGFEMVVDDGSANSTDEVIDFRSDAQTSTYERTLIDLEKACETKIMTQGNWNSNATPTTKWSATSSSTPVNDISTGESTVKQAAAGQEDSGIMIGIIADDVFQKLKVNHQLQDLIKYTTSASGEKIAAALAEYFGLDEIWVGDGLKGSAVEGQTQSGTPIWTGDMAILWLPKKPGRRKMSSLVMMIHEPLQSERYRDEAIRSWVMRTRISYALSIPDNTVGYVLYGCIS